MKDDPVAVVFFGGPLHDQHHVLREPLSLHHQVYLHEEMDIADAEDELNEQVAIETFTYELMPFYSDGLAVYMAMLEEDMDD